MIEGYLGRMGAGKSYSMISRALKSEGKRPIYSNMSNPPGDAWMIPIRSVDDLLAIEDGLVLMDEIALWFSARGWTKNSPDVLWYFAQTRKRGVDLLFTAQSDAMVDVAIRRLTATYWECSRTLNFVICKGRDPNDANGRYFSRAVYPVSPKVYERYESYEVIGYGDGSGYGMTKHGARLARERFDKLTKGWKVRAGGAPGLRPYHDLCLDDLRAASVSICKKLPSGAWVVVPEKHIVEARKYAIEGPAMLDIVKPDHCILCGAPSNALASS